MSHTGYLPLSIRSSISSGVKDRVADATTIRIRRDSTFTTEPKSSDHASTPLIPRTRNGRNLPSWLLLSFAVIIYLISLSRPSRPPSPASPPPSLSTSGRTIVGKRSLGPHHTSCTSAEFLDAIAQTRVNPDGLAALAPANRSFALDEFEFSFDWPKESKCEPPHVYTSEEACDAMGAWGGVTTNGDSLSRHLVNALFILLRDRPDGAVWREGDKCQGDRVFDDRDNCRFNMVAHTRLASLPEPVCGGKIEFKHSEFCCPVDPEGIITRYQEWRSGASTDKSSLSTIVINSFGLHCRLLPAVSLLGALKPFQVFAASRFPRPLFLWMGIHAPGPNKPAEWVKEQGPEAVKKYNALMKDEVEKLQPASSMMEGGVGFLDWYGMTSGASSFDGTHYSFQVNMEKAMLLLNLMDVLWAEAVEEGGASQRDWLCPGYQCGLPSNFDG
ncbi:hypothetical protein RQP46_003313 [Phenoliferia psychrophenolica]